MQATLLERLSAPLLSDSDSALKPLGGDEADHTKVAVQFVYFTGLHAMDGHCPFVAATLRGSWDVAGRRSDAWTSTPMRAVESDDFCRAFAVSVLLDADEIGQAFEWGVSLQFASGEERWGIPSEVHDRGSRRRVRGFRLEAPGDDGPQRVSYRLNYSRCRGAQRIRQSPRDAVQFSVWAPNAREVSVVIGDVWRYDGHGTSRGRSNLNPAAKTDSANSPLPRREVAGGYIADDGTGAAAWGPFAMARDDSGVWSTDPADPALQSFRRFDHVPYMFRVVKDDGSVAYRTDLYSRCQIGFGADRPTGHYFGRTLQLDGVVSCSVVVDPDRVTGRFTEPVFPEQEWLTQAEFWGDPAYAPRRPLPKRVEDLVIYELHVGALGFGKPADEAGTLEDALRLLDYLESLGVNAVELLPMSEFGGGGSGWGYATSHYFAIEYSGGGRDQYKWFIRECHRRGIAVIMDVVFNHFSHNAERAEWQYDSNDHQRNIYYWYEGRPDDYPQFNDDVTRAGQAQRVGTGGYLDNISTAWAPRYWDENVREMFRSAVIVLATEFNVDGFRFDQTTSIHSYNALHANGARVESANAFGAKLLREITAAAKLVKPDVMLMAEDHSNWSGVTQPVEEGGLGFDAWWYADFYHHLAGDTDKGSDYAKLVKTCSLGDDRPLAMDYFAGTLAATAGRAVVYPESHDEAGNGAMTHRSLVVAANGAPLIGETRRYAEARCRVAAGLAFFSAGAPMFLFGEEVGMTNDFLYGRVLELREDLHGLRAGSGGAMFAYYRDAIRLRLENAALRSKALEIVYVHNEHRLLAFRRNGGGQEFLVVASFNNRPFNLPSYTFRGLGAPDCAWSERFNSDSRYYGGDDVGNGASALVSADGELSCIVPANGLLVLMRR